MAHLEVLVLILVFLAGGGWCENVLFLYPNASPIHKNVALPLMLRLVDRGYNVTVTPSIKTQPHENIMTEEILEKAIHRVTMDPSFKERAQKMSAYHRDEPKTPKERGIFRAEYGMRHKEARHLTSAAQELNYLQYRLTDVVAVLLIGVFLVLWATLFVFKFCVAFENYLMWKRRLNCSKDVVN